MELSHSNQHRFNNQRRRHQQTTTHQHTQNGGGLSPSPPPPHKKRTTPTAPEYVLEPSENCRIIDSNNKFMQRQPQLQDETTRKKTMKSAAGMNGTNQHRREMNGSNVPPSVVMNGSCHREPLALGQQRPSQVNSEDGHERGIAEIMPVPLAPSEEMSSKDNENGCANKRVVYKLVLTGGPCGGKTTGQVRLASFFEDHGWKVFTVPETASILLGGRIRFQELNAEQAYLFQKDLMHTLLQIEQVFFDQAEQIKNRNVLIICDRGAIDPSAYMSKEDWERLLKEIGKDVFDLRDTRYNQVIHMVTAADGAREYYTCENNKARMESLEDAIKQDRATREAWIGHPSMQIVDNAECETFEDKINKLIKIVSERLPIPDTERLAKNSKKRKWLVKSVNELGFKDKKYEEFFVENLYLMKSASKDQVRIRARRQHGRSTYTLTTRRYEAQNGTRLPEPVETRRNLDSREFNEYVAMRDPNRSVVHKKRRCFIHGNVYFHLDTYIQPLPPACNGQQLMILETYSTKPAGHPEPHLPEFLTIEREITGEPAYSMYNLAGPTNQLQQRNQF